MSDRPAQPHGMPFETAAGWCISYQILDNLEHGDAIIEARRRARHDGHVVIDVNAVVHQPYGGWIVELAIRANRPVR